MMEDAERSDLNKFCKFFSTRLIQGVVQSRLGQKVRTACTAQPDSHDWFNLKIAEYGEVTSEIRQATNGRFPPALDCLCLEFHLQTAHARMLPLECWCISFDSGQCDDTISVRGHLYHQMGTLLKSALAAARVTPAYRYYARGQGADTHILCYQLYAGQPNLAQLGADSRPLTLGRLASPFGTLALHLHLRTNMSVLGPLTHPDIQAQQQLLTAQSSNQPVTPPRPVKDFGQQLQYSPSGTVLATSPLGNRQTQESPCFSWFSTSPVIGEGGVAFAMSPNQHAAQHSSQTYHSQGRGSQVSGGSSTSESNSAGSMSNTLTTNPLHAQGDNTNGMIRNDSSSGCLFRMDIQSSQSTNPMFPSTNQHSTLSRHRAHTANDAMCPSNSAAAAAASSLPCEHNINMSSQQNAQLSGSRRMSGSTVGNFPFSALLTQSQSAPMVNYSNQPVHGSPTAAPAPAMMGRSQTVLIGQTHASTVNHSNPMHHSAMPHTSANKMHLSRHYHSHGQLPSLIEHDTTHVVTDLLLGPTPNTSTVTMIQPQTITLPAMPEERERSSTEPIHPATRSLITEEDMESSDDGFVKIPVASMMTMRLSGETLPRSQLANTPHSTNQHTANACIAGTSKDTRTDDMDDERNTAVNYELSDFVQECKTAPVSLRSFQTVPANQESELLEQSLRGYQQERGLFDAFLQSLGQDE